MAIRHRKQNRITLTTVIVALVILAFFNLVERSDLLPQRKAMNINALSFVEVHFIDVGQGESVYIKTPTQDILIDAGEPGNTVVNYLNRQNVAKLDLVIATNPESDHIGGFLNVLNAFTVREIMDTGIPVEGQTHEDYLALIDEKNIIYTLGRDGIKRTYEDGAVLEILHPGNTVYSDFKDNSIVVKLTFKDVSFLFASDAGLKAEQTMLAESNILNSTILKMGNHGSNTSTSDEFLDTVSPEAVVIMCALENPYGYPHKEIRDKLEHADIDVYRTDLHGTVVFVTDGVEYEVRFEDGGEEMAD